MSWLRSARMAGSVRSASSPQPPATRPWLPPSYRQGAGFICLSVCVCMFGVIVFARLCRTLLWGLPTLAVRYILTLWYGISHHTEWEDMETAGGEENRGGAEQSREERRGRETPTKMRRNVWVYCASACAPAYPGYSSISLRFSTFSSAIKPRGEK